MEQFVTPYDILHIGRRWRSPAAQVMVGMIANRMTGIPDLFKQAGMLPYVSPTIKKVALTRNSSRIFRIAGVTSGMGPSSKVR